MEGGRPVLPEQRIRYGNRELLISAASVRGLEGEALEQVRRMRTKVFTLTRLIDTGINNTNLTAVVGATYRGEPYSRSEARPWWFSCYDLSTNRQAISVCEAGSLKVDIVQGISLDSTWPGPRDHYEITREGQGDGFGTLAGHQAPLAFWRRPGLTLSALHLRGERPSLSSKTSFGSRAASMEYVTSKRRQVNCTCAPREKH